MAVVEVPCEHFGVGAFAHAGGSEEEEEHLGVGFG